MTKPRVYVAGPIHGSGNMALNLNNALRAAAMLREAGAIPFVPHLWMPWEIMHPHTPQAFWQEMDFEWLRVCHALVRIDGVSPGSDAEVAFAHEQAIPVFQNPNVSGAARPDVFTGVRAFIVELETGRFNRHLIETEIRRPTREPSFEELLNKFQDEVNAWSDRQPVEFNAGSDERDMALGITEEMGELAKAINKEHHKIRGYEDPKFAAAKKADAIGDIFVFAASYCSRAGISLGRAVVQTWREVQARDWNQNKENGQQPGPYSEMKR